MDIFNPTSKPQDQAISQAIDQAVEKFISGQFDQADRCFIMAEEFFHAPPERFIKQLTIKETNVF